VVFLVSLVEVSQEIPGTFARQWLKHGIVSEIKPGFILHFEWRQGLYTGMQITADRKGSSTAQWTSA